MDVKIATKKKLEGYAFVLPAFIYVLVILGYPIIYNVILSFKNTNIKNFKTGTSTFVGFYNYIFLFQDPTFRLVFKNTFVFTFGSLIFQFSIGFLLALLFSKKFMLAGPIRGLMLIPYMMPMSVTGLLGKNMFGTSEGVINDLFMKIGIIKTPVEWLTNTSTALPAVIAVNCWVGIPFNMLLLISGLTNIPNEIYDSAHVDGANSWQRFVHITLPMMRSSIFAVLMLGFIYTFKAFDLMFIMTNGGPLHSTDVLGTYSYKLSFTQYEFSLGSATAMVLFICLLVVALFYLKLLSREEA